MKPKKPSEPELVVICRHTAHGTKRLVLIDPTDPVARTERSVKGPGTRKIAPAPLPGRQYLTPEHTALFLGVCTKTLANWRSRKIGPPYCKRGPRIVRYPRDDLKRWAGSQFRRT